MRTFVASALGTAMAIAGTAYAIAAPQDPPDTTRPSATPPDSTPSPGARSLQARADATPFGVPMAVLTYRNEDGQKCFAMGSPSGDRIVAARAPGREVPLSLAGHCGAPVAPLSYQLDQTPEGIMVYGLAADDVASVELSVAGQRSRATPSSDRAFIAAIVTPGLTGSPLLSVTKLDGTTQTIQAAPLVDIAARNRALDEARRSGELQRLFDGGDAE